MRVLKLLGFGLAVMLVCISLPASATFVAEGPYELTGSWSQAFTENGVGNFTSYQFYFGNGGYGGPFEMPTGITTSGGWAQTYDSGTLVLASGPATTSNNFTLHFVGTTSTPLMFHGQAYNGTTRVDNADFYWNGGWNIVSGTWTQSTPLPEPVSMFMLGGLGAGMLAARRIRRKAGA